MANLKDIRKRIATVKSTQKITAAMKLVAGARLHRAQQRILAMRPYADGMRDALAEVEQNLVLRAGDAALSLPEYSHEIHPLLARREEKAVLLLVLTSDRGLCGSFNTNICKRAFNLWKAEESSGKRVEFAIVGKKGRDYFQRRGAVIRDYWEHVWGDLSLDVIRPGVRRALLPFLNEEVDSIRLVYNEFKNAAVQQVVERTLLPIEYQAEAPVDEVSPGRRGAGEAPALYVMEPDIPTVVGVLVPAYVEVTILRALYESMASELGARMTAMDAATKNASEMISQLTLDYNRARQAAITTELMEIISGAEALKA